MAEKQKKKSKDKKIPNKSHVENQATVSYDTKKPSMKTASDVISRILWDDALPAEKFTVGYLDRFDGIVETPFSNLDWNDPASVDNHTLALPKHRIQYFKYRNRKIWDKTTRKDIVFGSAGFSLSIHDFMAMVDQEKHDFYDEAIVRPKREGTTRSDDSDIEIEEEFDNSKRANFFIAARIKNESCVKNLNAVSDYIKSKDELLHECCIAPEMLHLTLCILRLDSPGEIGDAITAIKSIASQNLPLVTINLEGLDNFHHRVLYSRVEKNDDLLKLRQCLVDALDSSTITDKFSFVPHVTVTKLSRPVSRLRHSNYIDQYLYLKFEDDNFGSEEISELYLCEMGAARSDDGFYKCAAEVSLN